MRADVNVPLTIEAIANAADCSVALCRSRFAVSAARHQWLPGNASGLKQRGPKHCVAGQPSHWPASQPRTGSAIPAASHSSFAVPTAPIRPPPCANDGSRAMVLAVRNATFVPPERAGGCRQRPAPASDRIRPRPSLVRGASVEPPFRYHVSATSVAAVTLKRRCQRQRTRWLLRVPDPAWCKRMGVRRIGVSDARRRCITQRSGDCVRPPDRISAMAKASVVIERACR